MQHNGKNRSKKSTCPTSGSDLSIEIAPDGKSSMKEVIEGFKDLATHLHKLHQDEYLKMTFKSEGKADLPEEVSGGLYS